MYGKTIPLSIALPGGSKVFSDNHCADSQASIPASAEAHREVLSGLVELAKRPSPLSRTRWEKRSRKLVPWGAARLPKSSWWATVPVSQGLAARLEPGYRVSRLTRIRPFTSIVKRTQPI